MRKILAIVTILILLLVGCKAQKEVQIERVEVPVVVTQEHTVESVRIDYVRDTLTQRDSVYYFVKGDTTIIEKWHYTQGVTNIYKVDTLHVYDSVPYPVEVVKEKVVTKIEEVERQLTWWQKTKMGLGTVFVILLVLGATLGAMRLYGKIKKR